MQPGELYKRRALTLGSGCKLAFIKHTEKVNITENGQTRLEKVETIKPVLLLIGINNQGVDGLRVSTRSADGCVGIITSELSTRKQIILTDLKLQEIPINAITDNNAEKDWLTLDYEKDKIVYPRIFINSLQLKTDSNSLVVNYLDYNNTSEDRAINYLTLKQYEDYSVLTRSLLKKYAITLDPELVIKQGIVGSYTGVIQPRDARISYSISNADTSIYLDALEVAKLNSMPKVSYDVKCNVFNSKTCETLYNKIGNIIRINDNDLKFKNVRGYISGFSLDLDNPDNDNIEVKNYKTKFEDLFSTITAQTELMKKNNNLMQTVSNAFTSTGELSQETLQSSIMKVDLDYAFNNGRLTIDLHNGIWGTSDTGVVAFRGGGIFTSTLQDAEGNWKWNTGITPLGINASLITTGQLDTNLIKIYSGDNLRFQMNGDGIFAYKSIMSDSSQGSSHPLLAILLKKVENNTITALERTQLEYLQSQGLSAAESVDGKQYVLFNDEGLTLIAKKGAKVLNSSKNNYKIVLSDTEIDEISKTNAEKANKLRNLLQIKRVEVSWDGFVLRNWENDEVFYADPDTGNLIISGTINATGGHIGAWNFNGQKLWADTAVGDTGYTTFVALNAGALTELRKANGDLYPISQSNFTTSAYCFWAGKPNPFLAPFSIKKNGELKATTGQIGGWKLTSLFLYKNNTIVLAPGGKNSNINVLIIDDEGNGTGEYKNLNLNGTVLWAPGPSGDTTSAIVESLSRAKFTLTKDGEITAESINGWIRSAFTTDTSPRIIISTSQDGITMRNMLTGKTSSQNFNTLDRASATFSVEYGGVNYGGNNDSKTAWRTITIVCKVTAGNKSKTFKLSYTLEGEVYKSGTNGAKAKASFSNIYVTTSPITFKQQE